MKSLGLKGLKKTSKNRVRWESKIAQAERIAKAKKEKSNFLPKKVNMERFVILPKIYTIGNLSKHALSLYPVLCSLADFKVDNWFHVPLENISKISGISETQLKNAMDELIGVEILRKKKVTVGNRTYWKYKVSFIRGSMIEETKQYAFIFHTCIIDTGIWAKLTPRAKGLYLAMRSSAKFDTEDYCETEIGLDGAHKVDKEIRGEWYRNRKWDICYLKVVDLCQMAGISKSNLSKVLDQLEKNRLVEKYNGSFKVFLKPKIQVKKTRKYIRGSAESKILCKT